MKWLLEFYHERRGLLARYDIEAALPCGGRAARLEGGAFRASTDPAYKPAELVRAG
jgi:hypothetical protein